MDSIGKHSKLESDGQTTNFLEYRGQYTDDFMAPAVTPPNIHDSKRK